ncbi:MAG: hypothetical protein ACYSU6_09295 [Planctomycetota bacterium]
MRQIQEERPVLVFIDELHCLFSGVHR